MDKKLGAPLDLVAFGGGRAKFWIEAKCDFAADKLRVQQSARDAMSQVWEYAQRVPAELQQCHPYIVHFLCPLPDEEQYPEWVGVFDRFISNELYTPELLKQYYEELYLECECDNDLVSDIRQITIEFEPAIGAAVLKFDFSIYQ